MKYFLKTAFTICIICFSIFNTDLFGQEGKKNMIGVHAGLGASSYGIPNVMGDAVRDMKRYNNIGIDYSRILSTRWDFCSGFEYTYNGMTVRADDPTITRSTNDYLKMATIPAQFKFHLGKLVYLNGGMFLNFVSTSLTTYTSLGCGLGIGLEHEFDSGIVIELNPYIRRNGFITKYVYQQLGFSLGAGYRF